MPDHRLEGRYELRNAQSPADGRPAWVTKVPKSDDLYIVSMAMKPEEDGFPLVMSGLMSFREGLLRNYGEEGVLGHFDVDHDDGAAIVWTDGTNVIWVRTS